MAAKGKEQHSWIGRLRFHLIDRIRGTRALALLDQLEALQFESPATLKARQLARLSSYEGLVRKTSPLYARTTSFDQFPIIDKAFARAHHAQLLNPHYRGKLIRKKTGGSTGEPFVYYTGVEAQSYLWACILLSWRVTGYRIGEPVAFVAGSSLFGSGWKQKVYYALMNVRLYSAFDMSAERLDAYADSIARTRCRLLYGYASAIHQLARHLLQVPGLERRPPFALRGVVCTAEVLTPAMRADIEQAFGVPCYSQYGCNDAGISAYECEQRQGFHLVTERAYHEVLEDGRLISTDLANDAFFLPRYDTGDLVDMSSSTCPCGRGFPLIAHVVGRANDMVEDGEGRRVHSEFFTHLFREDQRIAGFQVVYDARELVIILHCADTAFDAARYLERIGASLRFERTRFAINRPFIASPNAKHRFVLRVDSVDAALPERAAG
jgi:phenylacetate-CoA ligase